MNLRTSGQLLCAARLYLRWHKRPKDVDVIVANAMDLQGGAGDAEDQSAHPGFVGEGPPDRDCRTRKARSLSAD
jgi:hypothetical protein